MAVDGEKQMAVDTMLLVGRVTGPESQDQPSWGVGRTLRPVPLKASAASAVRHPETCSLMAAGMPGALPTTLQCAASATTGTADSAP